MSIAENLKHFEPKKNHLSLLKTKTIDRVLIIEDDISLTNLLTHALEKTYPRIEIDWATSGEEAESYLKDAEKYYSDRPYDLIIADIFLEGTITGLDIWKLCDQRYPATNILVTSSMSVDKFVSCLKNEYACPAYLPKPFTLSECMEAIDVFL